MYALLVLLLGLPLMGAQLKVDHVTVAGHNLSVMRRALEAAGLPDEYGGPHANHATEMALTSFPDGSYLELIAVQPHADPAAVVANQWHVCLATNGEPCGWAVRPANVTEEAARLRTAGIRVTPPAKGGRKRPDGVQLEWENAQVGTGNGNFFPFLIHDLTPRERRAYPSGKPTAPGFTGIVRVVLAVNDLEAGIAQYEKAYGLAAPRRQDDPKFGAKLAWFPGTPVILAAPSGPQSWLVERLRRFGELPCAFVLGSKNGKSLAGAKPGADWFGAHMAWVNPEVLGWHLGVLLERP